MVFIKQGSQLYWKTWKTVKYERVIPVRKFLNVTKKSGNFRSFRESYIKNKKYILYEKYKRFSLKLTHFV